LRLCSVWYVARWEITPVYKKLPLPDGSASHMRIWSWTAKTIFRPLSMAEMWLTIADCSYLGVVCAGTLPFRLLINLQCHQRMNFREQPSLDFPLTLCNFVTVLPEQAAHGSVSRFNLQPSARACRRRAALFAECRNAERSTSKHKALIVYLTEKGNHENRTPSQQTEQTHGRWTQSRFNSSRLLKFIRPTAAASSSVGGRLFLYHWIPGWENRDAITSCQRRDGSDGDS